MKHLLATSITIALLSLGLAGCGEKQATKEVTSDAFVTIQGQDLIKPDGTKLFIMGTNLGNLAESGRIHVQVQQDQFRPFHQ